jgi:hypothetical protein
MAAFEPESLYLTHYGRVQGVPALTTQFLGLLDGMVAIAERERARGTTGAERHEALKTGLRAMYRESLQAHGCTLPAATAIALLELDAELNAQGIAIWLDRAAG